MNPADRLWQRLPRVARRRMLFGWKQLIAPRPSLQPERGGSVSVAGYLSAPSGLGEGARRMLVSMRQQSLDAHAVDVTRALFQGEQAEPLRPPPPGPGAVIVHVNGFMQPWALATLGRAAVARKHIIGYWAWELPELPPDWSAGFRFAHEIWVPTRFVATAVEAAGSLPVRVVPHPTPAPRPAPLDRNAFGLPADAFVSLVMFDANSSLARKNPLAAIRAHRAAFGDRSDRILVLKTHGTERAGKHWAPILEATQSPNIRVIDQVMPEAERWALMAAADVLVSPHRAEGYGLAIAEAMSLGRAVVATGWSGNTDFMVGPGCYALPFRLIPAEDPTATYHHPQMHWADPDETALAAILHELSETRFRPPPVAFPPPRYEDLLALRLRSRR